MKKAFLEECIETISLHLNQFKAECNVTETMLTINIGLPLVFPLGLLF